MDSASPGKLSQPITNTQSCKGLQVQNWNTLKPAYFVADPDESTMSAVRYSCHKKTPQIKRASISLQTCIKINREHRETIWKKFPKYLPHHHFSPGTEQAHILQNSRLPLVSHWAIRFSYGKGALTNSPRASAQQQTQGTSSCRPPSPTPTLTATSAVVFWGFLVLFFMKVNLNSALQLCIIHYVIFMFY